MAGIGQQRQRAGEDAADDLDDHEKQDDAERDDQRAPTLIPQIVRVVVMAMMVVARVVAVIVSGVLVLGVVVMIVVTMASVLIVMVRGGLVGTGRRSPTHASPAFPTSLGSRTPSAGSISNSVDSLYSIQQSRGLLLALE